MVRPDSFDSPDGRTYSGPPLPPLPPKWTGKFRKRPVEVEAVQLIDDLRNHTEIATWITVNGGVVDIPFAEPCLFIQTMEGRMRADIGDWVIKGMAGEFCPCKPDIFEATYEPANATLAAEVRAGHVRIETGGATTGAPRPQVVCLCGSTRFYDQFQEANYDLTMRGEIVLSVGFYPHAKARHGHGEGVGHDSAEKTALDELHKRKIDLAGYVLVVSDESGYFGQSTAGEIAYAVACGKPVRFAVGAAEKRAREAGLIP